jgi:glycosyltransferase involved in cell wall biosynthesis
MRILLCSNFYYRRGGDCTYLLALQKMLEEHGHETAVFSMRHPQNLPCPQEEYFVDFLDYAELNKARNPWNAVKVLGRSIWSRQAKRNVARLIADWKPDVAHLQNVHAYLTPSILGPLKAAGVPVVWTLHDFKLLCPDSHFLSNGRICEECRGGRFWRCAGNRCKKGSRAASLVAALEAYVHRWLGVFRAVDRFIAPSRFLRDKFVEFGWPAERFSVLPNFLPAGPAPRPRPAGAGTYGLYLGTLLPFKGVGTLLRALAKAAPHPFHVLGDGESRGELERLAGELGLGDRVAFRGFVQGAELERELAGARYAAVPSECYENLPYAALELMARGVPVAASNLGGLPELVRAGETGLLFPAGAAEALAERIGTLWGDPALCAALGERARDFVRAHGDAERHLRELTAIYDGLRSARRRT